MDTLSSSHFASTQQANNNNNHSLIPKQEHEPQLVILKQTSLAEEKFAKNGIQKNVHVVVKNTPFFVQVGIAGGAIRNNMMLDFNLVTVEADLLYDTPEDRTVDFIRKKPLEYKATISDRGDSMTIEFRMKVLSSQLEDMHFRIRLRGVETVSKQAITSLKVDTQPIKVVSKPDQVRKKDTKTNGTIVPRPRKRKQADIVAETLARIEEEQKQTKELLKKIYQKDAIASATMPNSISALGGDINAFNDPLRTFSGVPFPKSDINPFSMDQTQDASTQFEQLFNSLLDTYNKLDAEDRPSKIRKIVRSSSSRSAHSLCEMLDHFNYEIRKETGGANATCPDLSPSQLPSSTSITADSVDELYKEFFSLPETLGGRSI